MYLAYLYNDLQNEFLNALELGSEICRTTLNKREEINIYYICNNQKECYDNIIRTCTF